MKLSGILTLLLIAAAAAGGYWYAVIRSTPTSVEEFLNQGQIALAERDPKKAKRIAKQALAAFPNDNRAKILASAASAMDDKLEDAIGYLESLQEDDDYFVDGLTRRGVLQIAQGHVKSGMATLDEVIKNDPANFDANSQMFNLLRIQGRNWEARPYLFRIWMHQRYNMLACLTFATVDSVFVFEDEDKKFIDQCSEAHPEYALPFLGQGIRSLRFADFDQGMRVIDDVLKDDPNNVEAIAQKGFGHYSKSQNDKLKKWLDELPAIGLTHPLTWEVLGMIAEEANRDKEAARCYWESLRLHPDRSKTNTRLAAMLRKLDRRKDATPFAKRGRLLRELEQHLDQGRPETGGQIRVMVDKLEGLERLREAMAWCVLGVEEGETDLQERHKAMIKKWSENNDTPEGTLSDRDNPVLKVDLSDFPLPDGIEIEYDADRIRLSADVIDEINRIYETAKPKEGEDSSEDADENSDSANAKASARQAADQQAVGAGAGK